METGQRRMTLRRRIGKDEERTYLEVPFAVNGRVERIEAAYRYERGGGEAVVDIGLRSPERIVGWSGGARQSFFVGTELATPGYLAGPVAEGEWAVLLGAYKIPADGTEVTIDIVLTEPRERWIKGDLHMHSVHSDGRYTIEAAKASCAARGLDYMALTDHNTLSQNRTAIGQDERLLVLPGVELTSYFGHANVYGVPEALRDFRVTTPEQARAALGEIRAQGGFVSLNHPLCPSCPWEFGFDLPHDAIEVWNGPWRALNERAVAWWQEQLAAGRRLVALGGSDAHADDRLVKHGRPTAAVRTDRTTAQGVLDGIRQGRVVLSFDPDETFLTLTSGDYGVGDLLPRTAVDAAGGAIPLVIDVHGARGDRVALWSDRGLEASWDIEAPADAPAKTWEADAAAGGWAAQLGLAALRELGAPGGADCAPAPAGAAAAAEVPAVRVPAAAAAGGRVQLRFEGAADRLFYRLEARRTAPGTSVSVMTCLTNPLYIERSAK
ncbi:CehA/McbA family metallohydrolase [Paenibacillus sp. GCM10023250]|uniref:CehA/McbA family metallohydrolase n=1 Tax=Paenibacillus sp. GCM10023250 TaxID=3252648 RepID=UPI0036151BA7